MGSYIPPSPLNKSASSLALSVKSQQVEDTKTAQWLIAGPAMPAISWNGGHVTSQGFIASLYTSGIIVVIVGTHLSYLDGKARGVDQD
mmetsp:Transcript_5434/g.9474  ORF Transcript_5434/g.9474 Transcript_5434/m.9474 type:complete len:88 (+) Transcript_5434:131-394(+)